MNITALIFSKTESVDLDSIAGNRPTASIPFGGRYRLIDFALSNIVNADIFNVGLISEKNYNSLFDHLGNLTEWDLARKNATFHYITPMNLKFSGVIDKLITAKSFVEKTKADYVFITDSAIVANINFKDVINKHIESGKDITFVVDKAKKTRDEEYSMVFDYENNKIKKLYLDHKPEIGQYSFMGSCIISKDILYNTITKLYESGYYSFGRDFIQKGFNDGTLSINLYEFSDVVLRNNTIQHYLKNNLLLTNKDVIKSIFNKELPIYTRVRDEVPSYFGTKSVVKNSVIADGCIIDGTLDKSVLFRNVTVSEGATIKNSIIMANCIVEKGAYIENAIIDKHVVITKGQKLIGTQQNPMTIMNERN